METLSQTLSQKFLVALALPRDRLYALALARAGTPAAAEAALLLATRNAFVRTSANDLLDVAGALERGLTDGVPAIADASAPPAPPTPRTLPSPSAPPAAPADAAPPPGEPAPGGEIASAPAMPADVWARLAAAVQWEAARSSSAGALHADSQLLQPDPMLAPRQRRSRVTRQQFNADSPQRMLALIAMALLTGVVVTIYILTRPPGTPGTMPASRSAAPANPALAPTTAPASATSLPEGK